MMLRRAVLLMLLVAGTAMALRADVRIEHWLNVPGYEVTDTLAQGHLDRPPDSTRSWEDFEAVTSNEPDAVIVTGIVRAPRDGEYRFLIAADDTALLFVSTEARPETRKQVALVPGGGGRCDWTRYEAQKSEPITLKAGQRCLVQAVVKNGGGSGHVEVGWQLPNGRIEGPIPRSRIETPVGQMSPPPYGSVPAAVTIKPDVQPATTPGEHKFPGAAQVKVGDKSLEMSYWLFLPEDYDKTTDRRALFVFLHGNGHHGRDLDGITNEGPANFINAIPSLRSWMPMVVLCPQLPHGWRWDTPGAAEMTNGLVHEICKQYPRIDRDRVYLSGLSMGGKGTWLLAYDSPDTYAAIIPISGVAVRPDDVGKLSRINTWIICGEHDHMFTQGSYEMYEAMKPTNPGVKLTVVKGDGHGCWARYYPDRSFYEQVMRYERRR